METPTTSPTVAQRTALKRYVQTYFGGSLESLMTNLLRQESWSDDELMALRREIDLVRKERKRS